MANSDIELAPSNLSNLSADGVSHYEIGFPNVLRPPPKSCVNKLANGKLSFYAYLMFYIPVEEGEDTLLLEGTTNPTQFLLLNQSVLDEEITNNLQIRLNLPHKECVSVDFIPCGRISLDQDQVTIVKAFNTFLFSLILGKNFVEPQRAIAIVENKTKGYYVMPMIEGIDNSTIIHKSKAIKFIDWKTAINLVKCKLNIMKEECIYFQMDSNPQGIPVSCTEKDTGFMNASLNLKSGLYKEEELIDAFITYGPWSAPCFIIRISKDLTGLSSIPGCNRFSSYSEFWLKRYKVELKYASQPLLVCYTQTHVANFLQQSSQAHWCSAKARRVELPPEVCILHKGLKGCLWRGAFRLPSILCGLENALLAAELRDRIHVQISAFKLQEALTTGAYNMSYSYERLEFLGDSFLTLSCATMLFLQDASMNKEDLVASLHSIVENKELFRCAEECGLASYVFNEPFLVKEWLPPGPIPDCLKSSDKRVKSGLVRKQRISWRTLADVVEAIIGLFALENNNTNDILKAISWLRVAIDYPKFDLKRVLVLPIRYFSPCKIDRLEAQLGYHFKNVELVSMAFCYDSQDSEGGLHFSRLSYLGDCILSHYIAKHLITSCRSENVGIINELKQSVINKENLSYVCAKHKLQCFLSGVSRDVEERIAAYVAAIEETLKAQKIPCPFGYSGLCAPKVLGDLVASIAAGIYLDSDLDAEISWKIVKPLLEPLPTPVCYALHPVNELKEICKARHILLDIRTMFESQSGIYETDVFIDEKIFATFKHEEKRKSRKFAAFKALHDLKANDKL